MRPCARLTCFFLSREVFFFWAERHCQWWWLSYVTMTHTHTHIVLSREALSVVVTVYSVILFWQSIWCDIACMMMWLSILLSYSDSLHCYEQRGTVSGGDSLISRIHVCLTDTHTHIVLSREALSVVVTVLAPVQALSRRAQRWFRLNIGLGWMVV